LSQHKRTLAIIAALLLGLGLLYSSIYILRPEPPVVEVTTQAVSDTWHSSRHDYRREINFDNQGAALSNFRVVLRLGDVDTEACGPNVSGQGCVDVDYDLFANDGMGILFTTSAGVTVPHHIALWDTSGISYIWVEAPTVADDSGGATTSDRLHMYYGLQDKYRVGGATIGSSEIVPFFEDTRGIWGGTYNGVWVWKDNRLPFFNDFRVYPANDDTKAHGTTGTTSPGGSARVFDGSSDYIQIPHNSDLAFAGDDMCAEFLLYVDSHISGADRAIMHKATATAGWGITQTNVGGIEKLNFYYGNGSGHFSVTTDYFPEGSEILTDTWYYIVANVSNGLPSIWGGTEGAGFQPMGAAAGGSPSWGTEPLYIGSTDSPGSYFDGSVGYFSIKDTTCMQAGMRATWKNLIDKSLVQYGNEQQQTTVECFSYGCANLYIPGADTADGITRTLDVYRNPYGDYIDIVDIMKIQTIYGLSTGDAGWEVCYDLDGDGEGTVTDLSFIAAHWRETCDAAATKTTGDGVLAAATWSGATKVADQGYERGGNPEIDLAIDSDGLVRIAYCVQDDVDLAHLYQSYDGFAGALWNPQEIVTTTNRSGYAPGLEIDSNGYSHISYQLLTSPNCLQYAYEDGNGWHIESVHCRNAAGADVPGYGTHMVLDSNDYPHISYENKYIAQGYGLWYAYKDAGGWYTSAIGIKETSWFAFYNDIDLDSSGYAHIAYNDWDDGGLLYAYEDAGGWHTSTIQSGWYGYYLALVLDSDDYGHISHAEIVGNDSLQYTYKDAGGWHTETVDDTGNTGRYTSIALDSDGYPHISYYNVTDGALMYAYKDAGGWNTETLLEGYNKLHNLGLGTAIALDSFDLPHIAFYNDTDESIYYIYKR